MKHFVTILAAAALLVVGPLAAPARDSARVDRNRNANPGAELIRADDLIHAEAQDSRGHDLGRVEDIILNGDYTRAAFVVISLGRGGTGGEYKLVPWRAVDVSCGDRERSRGDEQGCAFVINATEAQLNDAYGFESNRWPDFRNPAWYRQADRAWHIEPDREDVQNYRHAGRPELWLVSHWPDTNAGVHYGGELGRVDDLVLSPAGDVAFVLIGADGRARYRDMRTVAVPPTMVYATNTGIVVNATDRQELGQYEIGSDRDMAQLTTRFERSARGQRYGHERQDKHGRGHYDRDRDRLDR